MRITLRQFQQIDEYMSREDLSDQDKLFFATCVVYGISEFQLDQMNITRVYKMVNRVNKLLKKETNRPARKRIGFKKINYDPSTYTLGQFISVSGYAMRGPFPYAHKIMAVISGKPDTTHERAEWFLNQPISRVSGSLKLFLERFKEFINRYKGLFGLDRDDADEIQIDPFQKNYGWIYSATQVAKHNGISLDQAMGLNVINAFNDLAYLKAKARYDENQTKKK